MALSIAANDDSGPIADMNTTPLVDVMLVLLILFIIMLPVMTNSTNLHIGRADGPPLPRETISLSIDCACSQPAWARSHPRWASRQAS